MLVSLLLIMIYVTLFLSVYIFNERQNSVTQRRNTASTLAYSNLKKVTRVAQIPSAAPYACTTSTGSDANNLTVAPDATGADLIAGGVIQAEPSPSSLTNVRQSLSVTYPQGCSPGAPVRIVSKVQYDTTLQEVSHATYVY